MFRSARPVRGATSDGRRAQADYGGFDPRAPCGARLLLFAPAIICVPVSIRAPRAGRDIAIGSRGHEAARFDPRAPCGARLVIDLDIRHGLQVSIRAPRAGRDRHFRGHGLRGDYGFDPRAPCGARPRPYVQRGSVPGFDPRAPCGARPVDPAGVHPLIWFRSARPVRGATQQHQRAFRDTTCFDPRAPCGARRIVRTRCWPRIVSIRAPRAGRDSATSASATSLREFRSARPVRGATPPRGRVSGRSRVFRSARPVRGATAILLPICSDGRVSIRAPRAGRDG